MFMYFLLCAKDAWNNNNNIYMWIKFANTPSNRIKVVMVLQDFMKHILFSQTRLLCCNRIHCSKQIVSSHNWMKLFSTTACDLTKISLSITPQFDSITYITSCIVATFRDPGILCVHSLSNSGIGLCRNS